MMTTKSVLFLLSLVLFINTGLTQNRLPVPLNVEDAIRKGSRSADGTPGIRYWQNSGDYSIEVNFDPVTRQVSGTERIKYFNNSPDTLNQLLFKLYPNLYQKGAIRATHIKPQDLTDGVTLTNLIIDQSNHPVKTIPEGTDLRVSISKLLPGHSLEVSLGFSYTLNMGSHLRTGAIDSGAFFIAYFFPRIAVYDDIDGWNTNPYIGSQEFYNDFCHFMVAVTVPDNYIVWATGELKNREEVLGQKYIRRIAGAEKSDGTVTIIDSNDLLGQRYYPP